MKTGAVIPRFLRPLRWDKMWKNFGKRGNNKKVMADLVFW